MKRATLVIRALLSLGLGMAALWSAASPVAAGATFGNVIQLPGHISEIVLDEPRSVLYAADFTAGQVDVISTTTNRLISSFNVGRSPSGIALSPDGQYLVVTNYNNLGVPTISSVTVVNLTDLSIFAGCLSGPDGGLPGANCNCADLDTDNDVDLRDSAEFLRLFNP